MLLSGRAFYGTSSLTPPYTREEVLAGRVVRLSPALITIIDGRILTEPPDDLRQDVRRRVAVLLDCGIRSLHLDINFDDYSGFGSKGPDRNAAVFTPEFVGELVGVALARECYVTLHLLTDFPERHLRDFESIPPGAVCFQLETVTDATRLADLVAQIHTLGAAASPVIETVGTDQQVPLPEYEVRARLEPLLPQIEMLTFQAAGTASRSNGPAGAFARDRAAAYLACLRPGFTGTIQIQGGITVETVEAAVGVGAEFLVAGTQIFRHRDGLTSPQVIDAMLAAAAGALGL